MKRVASYIDTLRVHWIADELQQIAVEEIMVTEYFKPLSRVSRLQVLCEDDVVEKVREIIFRRGCVGNRHPYYVEVSDFHESLSTDPGAKPVHCRLELQ